METECEARTKGDNEVDNVPPPVPVPVPVMVGTVLDDATMITNEPIEEVVEENAESGEEGDVYDAHIPKRNYYQIAHDLQQHDETDAIITDLLPADESPLDPPCVHLEAGTASIEESEHLDTAGGPLMVTVANPEKTQTPMESYITYEVKTETTRLEYAASSLCIRRRFQDFIWLKEKLEAHHPGTLIPPLPSKQQMKQILDKFSVEFVRKRCIQLNSFIKRVSSHAKLTRSKFLRKFLTLASSDFSLIRKSDSNGLASKFTNITKIMSPMTIKPKWTAENDVQEKLQDRMDSLEKNTDNLANVSQKLSDYYDILLPSIISWEKNETKEDLCNSLSKYRVATSGSKECCDKLASKFTENIVPIFTEYGRYSDSVKRLLKRRDNSQAEVEDFQDTISSKKGDENAARLGKFTIAGMLSGNSESQRQDRIARLQIEIKEFEAAETCAKRNLEAMEEEAKNEILKYNQQRAGDLADTFSKMALYQATYYEDMANAWRTGTSIDIGE